MPLVVQLCLTVDRLSGLTRAVLLTTGGRRLVPMMGPLAAGPVLLDRLVTNVVTKLITDDLLVTIESKFVTGRCTHVT